MSTDHELLELAAKAAGFTLLHNQPHHTKPRISAPKQCGYVDWNPLEDDGDALRLAVLLNMSVEVRDDLMETAVFTYEVLPIEEPFSSDRFASTRRAIVRAAAEIGRAML